MDLGGKLDCFENKYNLLFNTEKINTEKINIPEKQSIGELFVNSIRPETELHRQLNLIVRNKKMFFDKDIVTKEDNLLLKLKEYITPEYFHKHILSLSVSIYNLRCKIAESQFVKFSLDDKKKYKNWKKQNDERDKIKSLNVHF